MRTRATFTMLALSLAALLLMSACGGVELERVRSPGDSAADRLEERAREAVSSIQGLTETDISIRGSEQLSLRQLQQAGIPVGSTGIACDRPLDVVFLDGNFSRDELFSSGVSLAGGSLESVAMQLVAQIYDPETDMPLGMIGDSTGSQLGSVLDGTEPGGTVDGMMMLERAESTTTGGLVPEAICPAE